MVEPGNYRIVSLAGGGDLAVQFNGPDANLIVAPLEDMPAQIWVVDGPAGGPQSISPLIAGGLQTQPAGDFVRPQGGPFVWNIVGGAGVFQIQAIGQPLFWRSAAPLPGQDIVLGPPGPGPLPNWNFIP